ncbi:MAG: hypothetical protein SGCHY_001139 [Lobulomycetales sp.]
MEQSGSSETNNIKVICRFRPQNKREIEEGGQVFTDFDPEFTSVYSKSKEYPGSFTFDKCFDWSTSQEQLFNSTASATIAAENDNLPVHEEKSKGVYVKGLLEVFVGSVEEVFTAMDQGQANRVVASTSISSVMIL